MEETQQEEIDPEAIINELVQDRKKLETTNVGLQNDLSSLSSIQQGGNIAQYQIENTELLDKLEHFYRGEYEGYDDGGNLVWKKPVDKDQIPFNNFGVSCMMEVVSKYIDKNTSLSNYSEMRIYEILGDLGDELILLIQCNYEKIGMDTTFKKTKFRMIVVSTMHIIESTYRKSIGGDTMKEINQSRIISQSDFLGRNQNQQMSPPQHKGGFFKNLLN